MVSPSGKKDHRTAGAVVPVDEAAILRSYVEEVRKALPRGFAAKGNLFVFVDECHRTQSGELHKAMKATSQRQLRGDYG